MWAGIKALILFTRRLTRIARTLEEIRDLYRLDLESRGIVQPDRRYEKDPVEVQYGYTDTED